MIGVMIFLSIEMALRNIDRKRLIKEFKNSKELRNCDHVIRSMLLDVINNHNFKPPHTEKYYQSATIFDQECCKFTKQSMCKPNPIVEEFAEKVLKPLDTFAERKGIYYTDSDKRKSE